MPSWQKYMLNSPCGIMPKPLNIARKWRQMLSLVALYADLFAVNDAKTDAKLRNSPNLFSKFLFGWRKLEYLDVRRG